MVDAEVAAEIDDVFSTQRRRRGGRVEECVILGMSLGVAPIRRIIHWLVEESFETFCFSA